MTSSPRSVPFLPDEHPYWTAYHFPAMTRCDPEWHKAAWLNYKRAAETREKRQEQREPEAAQ